MREITDGWLQGNLFRAMMGTFEPLIATISQHLLP